MNRGPAALMALAVAAAPLVLTTPARAAGVSTHITTVSGPDRRLDDLGTDDTPPPGATISVSGTSTGLPSVDVRCYDGTGSSIPVKTGLSVSEGSWSTGTIAIPVALYGHTCTVYAVGGGTTPTDLSPFSGARTLTFASDATTLGSGPANSSTPVDHTTAVPEPGGTATFSGPASCGLRASVSDPTTLDPGGVALDCAVAFGADDTVTADDAAHTRSNVRPGILVDGVSAFVPAALASIAPAQAAPAITHTTSYDPGTGIATIDETEPITACPGAFPTTCPTTRSAGVALHRHITTTANGRVAAVADTWQSTDGRAHSLDLQTELGTGSAGAGTEVPWVDTAPVAHDAGTTFGPGPHEPSTLTVLASPSAPPSLSNPVATATWSLPVGGGVYDSDGDVFVGYARSVPAGGSAGLTTTLAWGTSTAEVDTVAAAASLAARPVLTLDPIAPVLATKSVTVTGSVSPGANSMPTTVTSFSGLSAPIGPDHRFSLTLPVPAGPGNVTLVASDDAGLSDTETRGTYVVDPLTLRPVKAGRTTTASGRTKTRYVKIPLACAAAAPAGCRVHLTLRDGRRLVASRAALVRSARSATVMVTLPPSVTNAVARLGRDHSLTLVLALSDADPAGAAFTRTTSVKVRR